VMCHYEDSLLLCVHQMYICQLKHLITHLLGMVFRVTRHVHCNTITVLVTDKITLILNTNECKQVYGSGCRALLRLSELNPLHLFSNNNASVQLCLDLTNGGNVYRTLIASFSNMCPVLELSCGKGVVGCKLGF